MIAQFTKLIAEQEKKLAKERHIEKLVLSETDRHRKIAARQVRKVKGLTARRERERRRLARGAVFAQLTSETEKTTLKQLENLKETLQMQQQLLAASSSGEEIPPEQIAKAIEEVSHLNDETVSTQPTFSRTLCQYPTRRQKEAARSNFFKLQLTSGALSGIGGAAGQTQKQSEDEEPTTAATKFEDVIPAIAAKWQLLPVEEKWKYIPDHLHSDHLPTPPSTAAVDTEKQPQEGDSEAINPRTARRQALAKATDVRLYLCGKLRRNRTQEEDRYFASPSTDELSGQDPLRPTVSSCRLARPAFAFYVQRSLEGVAKEFEAFERERLESQNLPSSAVSPSRVIEAAVHFLYEKWRSDPEVRKQHIEAFKDAILQQELAFDEYFEQQRTSFSTDVLPPSSHRGHQRHASPASSPVVKQRRRSVPRSVPDPRAGVGASATPSQDSDEVEVLEAAHTMML